MRSEQCERADAIRSSHRCCMGRKHVDLLDAALDVAEKVPAGVEHAQTMSNLIDAVNLAQYERDTCFMRHTRYCDEIKFCGFCGGKLEWKP